MLNIILIFIVAGMLGFMFSPHLSRSRSWQATLTPLSSIIGSGFLIIAPLLASVVGSWAPVAVTGIVVLAYAIGGVIRFNIMHAEPLLHERQANPIIHKLDLVANATLSFAYVTAVAFYLSLLSSFLLTYLGFGDMPSLERSLTTIIIVFIATTGYLRGLGGLEKLEAYAMSIQLSIVAALLFGVLVYDYNFMQSGQPLKLDVQENDWITKVFILAGILLVVQGFETSRFLGEKYNTEIRVKSMRMAQLISGVLYIISVIVLLPIMQHLDLAHIQIAEIVAATGHAAVVLPFMLIVAAIMSQFSAAVADTVGAGSLASESSQSKLPANKGYVISSILAVALVWTADLLEIISVASRVFALYYLLQCFVAIFTTRHHHNGKMIVLNLLRFGALAGILAFIVIFAIPAE
ncbi:MAG: hypothetical protein KZQ64_15885 [gamma proteobacterium symbiont of Bathyaustriella thionipta]|nr:hypothetical protein [gamma proteobacterium symbiont of Bathyaustriella thionipta]MCU7950479.1 hypothetical protein [gamma proteobacterium symbiont of Bathyaustriella thionipta]MCU7954849.1 hypothetical protein [gamma proteobacterium symbiont of Bathyaustriella thionipta]MCU7956978.1 hypothetical protein [gamma proteobacterium symbiont of Bathyaustriella thionipta]MCU7968914.1 hypothetical protein [gamma proteobacterium symbiont of Bathyaustriella thionipta]